MTNKDRAVPPTRKSSKLPLVAGFGALLLAAAAGGYALYHIRTRPEVEPLKPVDVKPAPAPAPAPAPPPVAPPPAHPVVRPNPRPAPVQPPSPSAGDPAGVLDELVAAKWPTPAFERSQELLAGLRRSVERGRKAERMTLQDVELIGRDCRYAMEFLESCRGAAPAGVDIEGMIRECRDIQATANWFKLLAPYSPAAAASR